MIKKDDYYTTHEIALLHPNYNSARTLLKALHDNQEAKGKLQQAKLTEKATDNQHRLTERFNELHYNTLSKIWNARKREGKRWLFKKEEIDQIGAFI